MDKLKLASSSLGERLKTGGAQMSRIVSTKMKEILQAPTAESKFVDEATSENMEEPNWGMNLRICAMINSEELSGSEIVKAIKKKISGRSVVSQRLSFDLLEACTSNCEKVFSEVASEKVLEEMVRMIDDPRSDHENRDKALQLIRAWGQSEDLKYLPVFHQTYMSVQTRGTPPPPQGGNSPPMQYSLESYIRQQPMSPPRSYPVPDLGLDSPDNNSSLHNYGDQSVEEKREFLLITRNSLDLFSSMLNSEPKHIKDDLMVSMLEKCKQSLPSVQRIAESTIDDEVMLFEALNLHDELQQVIFRYEEMEAALVPKSAPPENPDTTEGNSLLPVATRSEMKRGNSQEEESTESSSETKKENSPNEQRVESVIDKRSID
ncbi:TOM1-like protein 2 [Cornus florida]|uniref:TOM1-like protein 2 n=1 Tax=Cornus florida TaxID=4283 RepID=UPI00289DE7EE|nr:TOM1-like protein 2 [Cornus florida]